MCGDLFFPGSCDGNCMALFAALKDGEFRIFFSFPSTALCLSASPSSSLEITYFRVPAFADLKSEVSLECAFDLSQREELHSVKWYLTASSSSAMVEFYTYKPSKNPPARNHKIKGIRVDVSGKRKFFFFERETKN